MVSLTTTLRYDDNNRVHRFARTAVITALSLIVLLLIWWGISIYISGSIIRDIVPSPGATFENLVDLWVNGDAMTHKHLQDFIWSSLKTFLKGFAVAFLLAFPLGLLIGQVRVIREFTAPWIEVLRPIAPVAWAPIFILGLGYEWGPTLVVVVGAFFPLLTNVVFGVSKIDPNWTDAARTLGASPLQIFLKVIIPGSIPYVMNGVKVALGIGWMCIVSAELYNTSVGGLGSFIVVQAGYGVWASVYAAIFVIGILGLLTVGLSGYLHKFISGRMGLET